VEGSAEGFPADKTPTETFLNISISITSVKQFNLHAVGSFSECIIVFFTRVGGATDY
jgi:hypothetical protein